MSNRVYTYTPFIKYSNLNLNDFKFFSTEEKCKETLLALAKDEAEASMREVRELKGGSYVIEAFQSPVRDDIRGVKILFSNPDGSEHSFHHSFIKDFEILS